MPAICNSGQVGGTFSAPGADFSRKIISQISGTMALVYNFAKNVFAVIPAIVSYAVYVRHYRAVFSEF